MLAEENFSSSSDALIFDVRYGSTGLALQVVAHLKINGSLHAIQLSRLTLQKLQFYCHPEMFIFGAASILLLHYIVQV